MDRGRQSLNLLESHQESMGIREKGVKVGYHGQEAVRDGEGHGQDADLVIVSNLNEIVDVGGGGGLFYC